MVITPATRLKDVLAAHPFLLEFLAGYRPEFAKLRNAAVRATVGKVATIEAVATMGGVAPEALIADIEAEIALRAAASPGDGPSANRREAMKGIIRDLHAGASADEVRARFAEMAEGISSQQVAELEQELIDEGMPPEEIKRLCDVHVRVFEDALVPAEPPSTPPGHPVTTFIAENAKARRITEDLRAAASLLQGDAGALDAIAEQLEVLGEVDRHYLRKEHQLFPFLESHGFTGPSSVMWGIHDDVRALLKSVRHAAVSGDVEAVIEQLDDLLTAVDEMAYKEERILFPAAMELLSAQEWEQVRKGEPAIGYAWIDEPPAWPTARPATSRSEAPMATSDLVPLTTGTLSPAQIDLMIGVLPVDLSFVDQDDRVRFYSEGERIFPRSPAVVGRKVQACHPPASLDRVQAILDAFRAGERDSAEFWIEHRGRFVHIRYFAMRDAEGRYRGCLEVVQDVTTIRRLEGERRLID